MADRERTMYTSRHVLGVLAWVSITVMLTVAAGRGNEPAGQRAGDAHATTAPLPATARCNSCPAAERLAALEQRVTRLERQVQALRASLRVITPLPRDPRLWQPHDSLIQPPESLPQRLDRMRIRGSEQP
jgi:hypothetical protein